MENKVKYILVLAIMLVHFVSTAQDRFEKIQADLDSASIQQKGLNNTVNLSINHYTLQEVIRAIAKENNLNVSIDPKINALPSYNFSNASVKEVFLLLCKEHHLTLEWTGNIISFKPFIKPIVKSIPVPEKSISLTYNQVDSTLSGELSRDSLFKVIRKISQLTKVNIDLDNSLKNKSIDMTIVNQDIPSVLKRLSGKNELKKESNTFYKIEEVIEPKISRVNSKTKHNRSRNSNNRRSKNNTGNLDVKFNNNLVSVNAVEAPLNDIVKELCDQSNISYFMFEELKGNLTLKTSSLDFDQTLTHVLNTSDFTYKVIDSVYIIGNRNEEKFRQTEIFQFQHRTIEHVIEAIPPEIKKNVNIKAYEDLNSLILSGSILEIEEVKTFLLHIDKVVPMILIEIIIVDIDRSYTKNIGLSIKNDGNGDQTNGNSGAGGLNMVLNTNTLNQIVNSINSLGFFNLGNVGSGFYADLQALETNGNVKIHTTPKLAALNGHEARLSVGETQFYAQPQTNLFGTQSPTQVTTVNYKEITADLAIEIKPVVSGDDQITLDITVSHSDFKPQAGDAPPGSTKKEFKSIIRMKNQEMVVLGGLKQIKKSKGNSGIPWLSRIPVISWLFGNKNTTDEKKELTIFIRPTVIQ